jgi:hypothetical protein
MMRLRRSSRRGLETALVVSILGPALPVAAGGQGAPPPREPGITYLARADFMALVDDGLHGFAQDHPRAKEGGWEFTMDDRSYELYDFGDSLQLTFYVDARDVPGDRRDAFLDTVRDRVAQRPPPGATTTDVTWYPEYIHLIWIKASYVLDGSFGAQALKERYDQFMYAYSRDLEAEIRRVMSGMGAARQTGQATARPFRSAGSRPVRAPGLAAALPGGRDHDVCAGRSREHQPGTTGAGLCGEPR